MLVDDWSNAGSATGNPDYFHVGGGMGGDLPETPIAIVNPHGGQAVMGFVAAGIKGTDYREYLSVHLDAPMVPGEKYQMSFYITNGIVTATSAGGLGTSHLGVHFSSSPVIQLGNNPINAVPQFRKQSVTFDREWEQISFAYTADAAHEYLTLGVFGDDDDKTIDPFEGNNPQLAYYFVDDFSMVVIPDEIQSADKGSKSEEVPEPVVEEEANPFFIPNAFTPNGDGDNDVWRPVIPELSDYKLCIYNRWGELLFTTNQTAQGWEGNSLRGKDVEAGMYIWELSYVELDEEGNRVPRRQNGTVNLLR